MVILLVDYKYMHLDTLKILASSNVLKNYSTKTIALQNPCCYACAHLVAWIGAKLKNGSSRLFINMQNFFGRFVKETCPKSDGKMH